MGDWIGKKRDKLRVFFNLMSNPPYSSRRDFLQTTGLTALSLPFLSGFQAGSTLAADAPVAKAATDLVLLNRYLFTRPEIDPRHVDVTGNSGGGTQTT